MADLEAAQLASQGRASVDVAVTDGRTARAVRTRAAIVDACIELVDEGDLKPTAPRIAERAGVSVRSVFQHFDDLEGLFSAVATKAVSRASALLVPVDPDLPLYQRIDALVRQRSLLLEVITPVRRAALVHGPFSAEITRRVREGHDFLRDQVAEVFATELAALDSPERVVLLDALHAAVAWSTWDDLRSLSGRSVEEARAAIAHLLASLTR